MAMFCIGSLNIMFRQSSPGESKTNRISLTLKNVLLSIGKETQHAILPTYCMKTFIKEFSLKDIFIFLDFNFNRRFYLFSVKDVYYGKYPKNNNFHGVNYYTTILVIQRKRCMLRKISEK